LRLIASGAAGNPSDRRILVKVRAICGSFLDLGAHGLVNYITAA
jgi:hypothetical protein